MLEVWPAACLPGQVAAGGDTGLFWPSGARPTSAAQSPRLPDSQQSGCVPCSWQVARAAANWICELVWLFTESF